MKGDTLLACLLPGLRDVRTPLTVGYLWLFIAWLWFADRLPRSGAGEGYAVGRTFELLDLLGRAGVLASLTFTAYVVGALLTLPVHIITRPLSALLQLLRRLGRSHPNIGVTRLDDWLTVNSWQATSQDYQNEIADAGEQARANIEKLPPGEQEPLLRELDRALNVGLEDLRTRLLVASSELYGEFDRFEAEAVFRANLSLAVLALGLTAMNSIAVLWGPFGAFAATILLLQGRRRNYGAVGVLQRATVAGIIKHPAQSLAERVA